jgi:hypothetical protein
LCQDLLSIAQDKKKSKGQFVLHGNAPSHNAATMKQVLANRKVAVLHHPTYLPEPALVNYFVFPKLKSALQGWHFQSITEIRDVVTGELKSSLKVSFQEWIKNSMNVNRCINLEEMYVKNNNSFLIYAFFIFYNFCPKTLQTHLVHINVTTIRPKSMFNFFNYCRTFLLR